MSTPSLYLILESTLNSTFPPPRLYLSSPRLKGGLQLGKKLGNLFKELLQLDGVLAQEGRYTLQKIQFN